jgi:uncharacterized membrane protein YphA (DoxX/SURF4 family)
VVCVLHPSAAHGPVPALAVSAAWLLLVTGPAKLRSPRATGRALSDVGLPGRPAFVRLVGLVELGSALLLLLAGHDPAASAVGAGLCAGCYLGFSAFLVLALARKTSSCGCTARSDTPPTRGHLALTLCAAAVCVAAAVTGGSLTTVGSGADGPAVVAATAVLAGAAWLVVAVVPAFTAARRLLSGRSA